MSTFLLGFFICFVQFCHATVVESKEYLLDSRVSKRIKWLISAGYITEKYPIGKDVNALILCGGSFADVIVIGSSTTSAKNLADTLDRWVRANQLGNLEVQWSKEENCSVAVISNNRSRWFGQQAQITVPFGSLVRDLQADGYKPAGGVFIPRYARHNMPKRIEVNQGKRTDIYNIAKATTTDTVQIGVTLSPWSGFIVLLFVFGVPVVVILSFVFASFYAKNPNIDRAHRRKVFPNLVKYPCFIAIGVHAPFAFYAIGSRMLYPICDVWFGSSSAIVLVPFLFLSMAFPMVGLPLVNAAEARLFSDNDRVEKQKVTKFGDSNARIRLFITISCLSIGIGIYLVGKMVSEKEYPWFHNIAALAIFPVIFSSNIANAIVSRRKTDGQLVTSDDPVVQRVVFWAEQFHATVQSVDIIEPTGTAQTLDLVYWQGKLSIPRRAINELTSDELDYAIASSLNQPKLWKPLLLMIAVPLPLILFFVFFVLNGPLRERFSSPFFTLAGFLGLMAVMFIYVSIVGTRFRKKEEIVHRAATLRVTGNGAAARTYSRKRIEQFLTSAGKIELTAKQTKAIEEDGARLEKAIEMAGLS